MLLQSLRILAENGVGALALYFQAGAQRQIPSQSPELVELAQNLLQNLLQIYTQLAELVHLEEILGMEFSSKSTSSASCV